MSVADATGHQIVELVGFDPFMRRAAADPQLQDAPISLIAVEVYPISTRSKERNCAAIETKQRRSSPTRGDIECFVTPFRDATFSHQPVDDGVNGATDRHNVAVRQQPHSVAVDGEDLWKASQCI